ncbi:HesA/MoeB/ThiF family protein [Shewanella eurypsychrophilus]|uniref:HesA/MoeB/ThiF family protein n=1 Tax=Shewanella eurypsychrophilus TaxID=2593656 RepID=A0ABX6VBM8_9GAMM|nr:MULTISPECIES: HesA/MoeB/ThiF family protein [Shewanella]QFU22627.1 HesA/MoeB/ThiF family protein [Shewanella sp. YLB-09]QPG57916.1 HesA/MoeB/ThiF family protein [Shewanella eurypsychrophilus]
MSVNDNDFIRFSRQILLPEVGEAGQVKLHLAKVVIIGVGGLGTLVAEYLAAAGIGKITLVDHDRVELSNLPRQLLFSEDDINQNKAQVTGLKLANRDKSCELLAITDKFSVDNGEDILAGCDLVFDCTDDFNTRQAINLACLNHAIPLISASVANFSGQLLVVDQVSSPDSGCYACLFPSELIVSQSCQTVGILGPMVGVMASMQALNGMNFLLGVNGPLGKLLRFDGREMKWREAQLNRDHNCPSCGQTSAQSQANL